MHKTRRESLETNVMAALAGQRLTVTDIGTVNTKPNQS